MKYLRAIIIVILCVYLSPNKAISAGNNKTIFFSFSFPINHLIESERLSLHVKTPEGYRALQELAEAMRRTGLLEYIPQGEDEWGWSNIFTIHALIGKGLQAKDYTDGTLNGMKGNSQKSEILENETEENKYYKKSRCGISYTTSAGRSEVAYIVAFSGPADLVAIQNACVLKPGQSSKEVLAQLKQKTLKSIEVIKEAELEKNKTWQRVAEIDIK